MRSLSQLQNKDLHEKGKDRGGLLAPIQHPPIRVIPGKTVAFAPEFENTSVFVVEVYTVNPTLFNTDLETPHRKTIIETEKP